MEENDPFENITDDWYFCSIMNKEVRFISHLLRGVTYFIVLEYRNGNQYDVPIKKNDIVQYLSKFKLIEDNAMKENKNNLEHEEIIAPVNGEEKTISGLRNDLFETISLLKSGKIKTAEAKEISTLAQVIINSAKLEIEYRKQFKDKQQIRMLEA